MGTKEEISQLYQFLNCKNKGEVDLTFIKPIVFKPTQYPTPNTRQNPHILDNHAFGLAVLNIGNKGVNESCNALDNRNIDLKI